jgi:hypothetical protein
MRVFLAGKKKKKKPFNSGGFDGRSNLEHF